MHFIIVITSILGSHYTILKIKHRAKKMKRKIEQMRFQDFHCFSSK